MWERGCVAFAFNVTGARLVSGSSL